MKLKKSLSRIQCMDALIGLNNETGIAKEIWILAHDKYFWDKNRRFTSQRFVDLLLRRQEYGQWKTEFEKKVLNNYFNNLQKF